MSEEHPSGNHPQVAPKAEVVAIDGGPAAPSKSALKKAAKEKEKAEKAAKRAEEEKKQKEAAAASDTAKNLYGEVPEGYIVEEQTSLEALSQEFVGKQVTLGARVYNARIQSAKLGFLHLREGRLDIQAVIAEGVDAGDGSVSRQMVKWCSGLNRESYVLVTALVQKPFEPVKSARISELELHIQRCYLLAEAPEKTPILIKDADSAVGEVHATEDKSGPNVDIDTRLDSRYVDLRTPLNLAIFSVNGKIKKLFREFMDKEGFHEAETPKLLGAATEGGASVFPVTYFGRTAYLAQSPQFYKQMLISADWKRVYEIGHVFRAENSNTARHLTEFTGLDFEMQLQPYSKEGWQEVVRMAEDMVLYIFRRLPEEAKSAIDEIRKHYPAAGDFKLPEGRPPRIKFSEGIALLREAGHKAKDDEDISTTNEKALGDIIRHKYSSDFFTMTHYPVGARPFYTHLDPTNPSYTLSYDGFVRGQEIVSGAQRVHNYDALRERMKSLGVNPDDPGYKDYLEAIKQACPPHGGAGFGLNRMTMLYLGLPNIRLATLFPRDPQRLVP